MYTFCWQHLMQCHRHVCFFVLSVFYKDDGKYLIFRNMILSNNDPRAIITRDAEVDIEFFCKYSKRGDVVLSYIAHRPPVTFTEKGFGTFTYQFEFFQSQALTQQKDINSYPLEFDVGDMMYMQIESISSVPNTELFAESCRATPSDNPHDTISYPIILHGCKADETVQLYANGNRSKVQFAMKAFKFIGHHDQVYITCSVILCEAGMTNSRCSQGCSRITKREVSFQSATNHSSGHQIHNRDVPSEATGYFLSHSHHKINERAASYQTSGHFISQGPVRLRHQIDSPVAEGMNKNLIFSVSCLLAAIAMAFDGDIIFTGQKHFSLYCVALAQTEGLPVLCYVLEEAGLWYRVPPQSQTPTRPKRRCGYHPSCRSCWSPNAVEAASRRLPRHGSLSVLDIISCVKTYLL
ncbi:CUB and zona pellucida-like domain-containing protein 1 [Clupea harengus]|uniref:CUB and zona pellucida-like domain-containing protein 1 n=1 Tax=Clupea harengus TaxID=7950 RepID=A0A6P8EKP4_CLUHA|nr:CUB and zona pellucida-like domain-containing protein 1 [Clupea harengus]